MEEHEDCMPVIEIIGLTKRYGSFCAVDKEDMMNLLMKAFAEEEADSVKQGMVCGPDGCHPSERSEHR